jgi:hypothetical protein
MEEIIQVNSHYYVVYTQTLSVVTSFGSKRLMRDRYKGSDLDFYHQ